MHADHMKKSFVQKVGALKSMKLPVKVLEEIYFKSIVPAVTYGIVVWGYPIMNSLNLVQARAARVIHQDKKSWKAKLVANFLYI